MQKRMHDKILLLLKAWRRTFATGNSTILVSLIWVLFAKQKLRSQSPEDCDVTDACCLSAVMAGTLPGRLPLWCHF